jgi:hypothetical protein
MKDQTDKATPSWWWPLWRSLHRKPRQTQSPRRLGSLDKLGDPPDPSDELARRRRREGWNGPQPPV